MKVMLDDISTHQLFLYLTSADNNISRQHLAFIIKRLLLCRRNPNGTLLLITTVQTAVIVLGGPHGNTFAASLLQADVAGKWNSIRTFLKTTFMLALFSNSFYVRRTLYDTRLFFCTV
jgi:hypothetical protein